MEGDRRRKRLRVPGDAMLMNSTLPSSRVVQAVREHGAAGPLIAIHLHQLG